MTISYQLSHSFIRAYHHTKKNMHAIMMLNRNIIEKNLPKLRFAKKNDERERLSPIKPVSTQWNEPSLTL